MIENALMAMVNAIGKMIYEFCKLLYEFCELLAKILLRLWFIAMDVTYASLALAGILITPWTWPAYFHRRRLDTLLFEEEGDEDWWAVHVMNWDACLELFTISVVDVLTLPCIPIAAINPHRYVSLSVCVCVSVYIYIHMFGCAFVSPSLTVL